MPEPQDDARSHRGRRAGSGWLDEHIPASIPYIIGFALFIPALLAANIGLEFWLDPAAPRLNNLRDGLLNAGVMATWGIPLTIILTEGATRMWARDYIARKEEEAGIRFRQYEAELTARIRQEVEREIAAHIHQEMEQGMAARIHQEVERELAARLRQQEQAGAAPVAASADPTAQRVEQVAQREEQVALREELVAQQAALVTWYVAQVVKWQERQRQAIAAGKEFNEPAPEPPPGVKAG